MHVQTRSGGSGFSTTAAVCLPRSTSTGIWEGVGGCVAIQRAALHEALRDATAEVPVRLGMSVTALENGDEPSVTFSDGSTRRYDLIVGADGVHSTIRMLALGGPTARYVGQACWRFVADGFPDMRDWTVMLGRGRTFLTVALGQGLVYCYADVNTSDPAGVAREDWRGLFAELRRPGSAPARPGHRGVLRADRGGRAAGLDGGHVVLVGDAAHASSPNMAQGAAMAVEDVLVLAEMLTADPSLDRALAGYEERRKARVAWMQEQTHRRDRTRSLPPIVRNLTLRLAAERIFRSNYGPLRDLP